MVRDYFQKSYAETLRGGTAWLILILMNSAAKMNPADYENWISGQKLVDLHNGLRGIVSALCAYVDSLNGNAPPELLVEIDGQFDALVELEDKIRSLGWIRGFGVGNWYHRARENFLDDVRNFEAMRAA